MAKDKKNKNKSGGIDTVLLKKIASGEVSYVSQAEGTPLLQHNPPLIEVNTNSIDPNDATKAAVRVTTAGAEMANAAPATPAAPAAASSFKILSGVELPASKRGNRGGGAPTKYPFDQLEIGGAFFVPKSADMDDPVKTLGSTVSSANRRYSEPTGVKEQKERTKRTDGNKAERDAAGKPVRHMVEVEVRKPLRKFTIRPVEAGKQYGTFKAPADGALIARVALPAK